MAESKTGDLSGVAPFRGLSYGQGSGLASCMRKRDLLPDAPVQVTRAPGQSTHLILSGSVKVHVVEPDATGLILAILGPGGVVGVTSLAESLRRSSGVTILEDSTLLTMYRLTFGETLRQTPQIA